MLKQQNIVLSDIFTKKDVMSIAALDAPKVASNTARYVKMNTDRYYTLLNTWLYMCSTYVSARNIDGLAAYIRREGLLPVIADCSDLASKIIESDFSLTDLGQLGFLFNESPRITLQMLRYPKRFSPAAADKLRKESLNKFLQLNRRLKGEPSMIDWGGKVIEYTMHYPQFLIDDVKATIAEILHYDLLDEDPLNYGSFSNGVTADGCRTMLEKYRAFQRHTYGYHDNIMYPFVNAPSVVEPDLDYVKVVSVPKNYKTTRLIAEVSAFTQYHMQGIRNRAAYCLEHSPYSMCADFTDQEWSQELSRLGSIRGTYATIDLSSASDSISRHLAKQVLPPDWYNVIEKWNPPYLLVDGKKVKSNIFLTSGSGETFAMETIIFLAIAIVGTRHAQKWLRYDNIASGERQWKETLFSPRVYGDDIICDTKAYDTIVDFLDMLNFTVNEDKSFSTGGYRESCGAEWWCGLDTTTKYYPRRSVDESSVEYLETLTSLQHRIYEFENAERWLTRHINDLFGHDMTSSYPGTECDDLWGIIPYYYTVNPPYDHSHAPQFGDQRREAHNALVSTPWTKRRLNDAFMKRYDRPLVPSDISLCELIRYVDFLRHGTPLDDYGYPVHRQPVSDDLLIRENRWTTVIR